MTAKAAQGSRPISPRFLFITPLFFLPLKIELTRHSIAIYEYRYSTRNYDYCYTYYAQTVKKREMAVKTEINVGRTYEYNIRYVR